MVITIIIIIIIMGLGAHADAPPRGAHEVRALLALELVSLLLLLALVYIQLSCLYFM